MGSTGEKGVHLSLLRYLSHKTAGVCVCVSNQSAMISVKRHIRTVKYLPDTCPFDMTKWIGLDCRRYLK